VPKPPSTWKGIERFVAKYLGGERTHWAREDARARGFSIEVKHGKQISKFVERAYRQATTNCVGDLVPLLVLHWLGTRRDHSLVCLRLDHFREILDGVHQGEGREEHQEGE
jgi:hypothetical protein